VFNYLFNGRLRGHFFIGNVKNSVKKMDDNVQIIRLAAMNLLAMREHSAFELREKLGRKFPNHEGVGAVITLLIEQRLQNDQRFAEAFINMRYRQAKGPILIAMELKAKGVAPDIVESCMAALSLDWNLVVRKLRLKKFGQSQSLDAKGRARQVRFLQSRGFDGQHIRAAFSGGYEEIDS
jgi:regulatory protein